MQSFTLLVAQTFIFFSTFPSCNTPPSPLDKQTSMESIEEYSYLLSATDFAGVRHSGTGFFLKYRSQLYLVTNLHVLTGVDPSIAQAVIPKTYDSVTIWKWSPARDHKIPLTYKLFDSTGRRAFHVLWAPRDNQYFDIAVLPLPDTIKWKPNSYFEPGDFDTADIVSHPQHLRIIGFPTAFIETNKFKPTTIDVQSSKRTSEINLIYGQDLVNGFSGSPTYIKRGKEYKVIGIHSRSSSGFYIKFILQILQELANK